MKILKYKVLVFTILCFCLIGIGEKKVQAQENKEVLFISSYNPNFISFNEQINGIKSELKDNVQLQIEYMDWKNYNTKEDEENFYNLFKFKLNSYRSIDAIIVGDDEALEFVLNYRDELFTDIPIVFFGVSNVDNIEKSKNLQLVSGIREVESVYENLDLIKKLHDDVKNIYFIEELVQDNIISEFFYNCVLKYPDINFKRIETFIMDISEFEELVKTFDSDDALLIFLPHTFKSGEVLTQQQVIESITKNAKSPVYSTIKHGVGYGSIGGKVIDHYKQGKKVGEITQNILDEKVKEEIFILGDEANSYIFDYNAMKKYGIKKEQLPVKSTIINEPIPFIKKYKEIIIPISLIITALLCIIATLSIYIVNRIKCYNEIRRAKLLSDEANKVKDDFIFSISHELRTPISVIFSANQLLQAKMNNYDNSTYTDYCDIIKQNCNRLLRLINNVIDVAKLEAREMDINLTNENIVNLLESIVESAIPYANNKNIEVIFDTTHEEVFMAIDCYKFERAILNLISNSIKFSKGKGVIIISLEKKDNKIVIIVEDDGIGIDKKYHGRVFERHFQVDDILIRRSEGSGIGLSLVKRFIEMHNGTIKLGSVLGVGTQVSLEIPIILVKDKVYDTLENRGEKSRDENSSIEFSDIY